MMQSSGLVGRLVGSAGEAAAAAADGASLVILADVRIPRQRARIKVPAFGWGAWSRGGADPVCSASPPAVLRLPPSLLNGGDGDECQGYSN